MLGISHPEYRVIIENGVNLKLFETDPDRLTEHGEFVYQEINKSLKAMSETRVPASDDENDIIDDYIPKTLLGKE